MEDIEAFEVFEVGFWILPDFSDMLKQSVAVSESLQP